MKAVRDVFLGYTEDLEGRKRHPYADVKGYPTVGFGCIIDKVELALALEWFIGGRRATEAEVRADWEVIAAIGPTNRTADSQEHLTRIRLSDAGAVALLWRRFDANVAWLVRRLMPGLAAFPADAQLAVLSTAWATGCDFRNTEPPRLELIDACNKQDWRAAKASALLTERGNAGVIRRNRAMELCFENAARVSSLKLPKDELWWPKACPDAVAPSPLLARTDPVSAFVDDSYSRLLDAPSLGGGAALINFEKDGAES